MTRACFAPRTGTTAFDVGVRITTDVIGPDLRGTNSEITPRPVNFGWIAAISMVVATGLLLIVMGHGAGRRGDDVAPLLFWSGIVLLIVPISLRIAWPLVARGECLFLLFLLAEALLYYKTVYSPTSFANHDEFLHWVAADDLITARRLFLSNPLLPIAPVYPALEIVTAAIRSLTGLPLFAAGVLLLAVLKGTFIVALFLFYEKIAGSTRIAAIACLVYMGCSTFVLFESMFSYETLGIVLCLVIFTVEATSRNLVGLPRLQAFGLIALLLASLAVTHHLSAAFAALYLGALATLEALRRGGPIRIEARIAVGLTAILAVAIPLLWMQARGNPIAGYLGPVIESGFQSLVETLRGTRVAQRAALGAPVQPVGPRMVTLLATLLLALGLATGFFRTLVMAVSNGTRTGAGWLPIVGVLKRRWSDSRIVLLAVLALGFPVSVAFRLSVDGWGVGTRMGTFAFIGVGMVVAVGVVHFWQGREAERWCRIASTLALVAIVLGGVTSASLHPIRGAYKVSADQESVEPMAIETALWTKAWLGPGHRFTADRVNRLLLGSYGRQDVRVEIVKGVDVARVFKAETMSSDAFYPLAKSNLEFLLVDLRLSSAPPVLGFYFESWEAMRGIKLPAAALRKFNDIDGIARVYDNGWIAVYDVRGLHETP